MHRFTVFIAMAVLLAATTAGEAATGKKKSGATADRSTAIQTQTPARIEADRAFAARMADILERWIFSLPRLAALPGQRGKQRPDLRAGILRAHHAAHHGDTRRAGAHDIGDASRRDPADRDDRYRA